jgi:hypothetical protein
MEGDVAAVGRGKGFCSCGDIVFAAGDNTGASTLTGDKVGLSLGVRVGESVVMNAGGVISIGDGINGDNVGTTPTTGWKVVGRGAAVIRVAVGTDPVIGAGVVITLQPGAEQLPNITNDTVTLEPSVMKQR